MATPVALVEAGLVAEFQDGGARLVVREAEPGAGCPIRNRGGEALASLLQRDRAIRSLDISESKMADNGVGHLSLVLRQTDQLEELSLSAVGHTGLEFLLGIVRRCQRLSSLRFEVVDVPTLNAIRQTVSAADYDTSGYAGQKTEEEEGEEDEEPEEAAAEDEDEDPEAKERKKAEKLKKIFAENDYDSSEEQGGDEKGGEVRDLAAEKPDEEASGEEQQAAEKPAGAEPGGEAARALPASPALLRLLSDLLAAARRRENLTSIECVGQAVPPELRLDLQRAMEDHARLHERQERAREEQGARTAQDVLRDQMQELNEALGADSATPGLGEEDGDRTTRVGMRSYIGRRLFAALGEALFECQRYKSKENGAVSTPEGEIAFVAMHLRKHAAKAAAAAQARAAGSFGRRSSAT